MSMTDMTTTRWTIYESPFGPLTLQGGARGLTALDFPGHAGPLDEAGRAPDRFTDATRQLDEYFAGERHHFELQLELGGTALQRGVWQRLLEIGYATTVSYGALARALGRPAGVRAVAAAVGRTPVPIIVPCHRVIGADGALTGYRGGLQRKRALLDLERRGASGEAQPPSLSPRQLALM
jgi:methylated-DNA-[protein]-cysteine S-methyltransferase